MSKYPEKGKLNRIVVVGPVYPFKGGIAHYTGLMVKALSKKYEVISVSYKMQYPKILFKKEQRDYTNKTFAIEDTQYLINTANPFNIISSARKINDMRPDLVIVQWWHPYFAPCYQILCSNLKARVAFICHNVLPHERFMFDKVLTKNTLKKASFCVCHSEEDMRDLKTILPAMISKKNMHPTYNAFKIHDYSKEQARQMLGIESDEKILLFFGLVRKYKGLVHILNAMPEIIKNTENVKLYIVGDFGKDKQEYMELIDKLGIMDHLVIKDGYVPDEEVEPYFAAADINVCPYESATQSGILQIAFGFGLPALVTRVGGLPEVVKDGVTGFVVEPHSPGELADRIIKYVNEDMEETMRKNVVADSERFSWDRMTETIGELWQEI